MLSEPEFDVGISMNLIYARLSSFILWIFLLLTVHLMGFNEIRLLLFTVNPTFFIMTNSTSLSTRHSWRSRRTTSPQYVVKVCISQDTESQKYYTQIHFSQYVCFLSLVPRNQLLSVAAACKVLIEFSLMRLENPDEACAVSQVRNSNCTSDIQFKG